LLPRQGLAPPYREDKGGARGQGPQNAAHPD